ncbi:MAG: S24/S26 family peptidase [Proteobacteria bacterium]|jgi:hypothetical protein|nr:S24/S26 family peptidase [Pseudomonadota bacterium]
MRRLRAPIGDIRALSREVTERGGSMRFECRLWGTSMSPGIRPGDVLVVETASLEALNVGDVIVYLGDGGREVAHRLIRREGGGGTPRMIARADVPGAREEVVTPGDLIGRVVSVRRLDPLRRAVDRAVAAVRNRLSRRRWSSGRTETGS